MVLKKMDPAMEKEMILTNRKNAFGRAFLLLDGMKLQLAFG